MTGQQLKNSILQLAIQGKLVPQNPDDESASELLKRIRKEKEKLVKEKKIKKEKPLPEISEDEKPFDIPEGWVWCRVGEISTIKGGKRIPAGCSFSATKTDHIYIRVSDMKNGTISLDDLHYISDDIYNKISQYIITTNDIYMTIVGATIGKCGIVPEELNNQNLTENAARIIPYKVYKDYLLLCLTSEFCQCQFLNKTNQVGVQKMALNRFANTILPLPPLPEQHRIVEKIEELMPLVDEYDKAQKELNTLNANLPEALKKSILQEAIQGKLGTNNPDDEPASELLKRIRTEKEKLVKEKKIKKEKPLPEISEDEKPFDIPDNWVWCYMGDLFMHNNGKQLNKGNAHGEMMDYITTSNLYWEGFVLDKIKQMPFEKDEIERCQAIKGDLLICEGGDIGRACIWRNDYPIMLQNHIHKCRAYLPLVIEYFYYIFYFYNKTNQIGGKGIGIQGFSSGALHRTLIPLPPLQEQHRIVEKLNELLPKLDTLK